MSDPSPESYPVIVAAGDRGKARPILGVNKAFLDLAGSPVFTHVLAALENCPSVERIYMVGPKAKLEEALGLSNIPFKGKRPLRVVEQWDNLYKNIWNTFLLMKREGVFEHLQGGRECVLVVPSDIPLVIPEEIEEFIHACDMNRFDYIVGITSEEVLSRFYPQKHRRGIRLMYFHTREGSYRQNNLHLVRPLRVINRSYIQRVYDYRLQRQWGHIMGLMWEILRTEEGTIATLVQYLLLHLSALLYRIPNCPLYRGPAMLLPKEAIEHNISRLLRTRFSSAETHYGGAALDIDTPQHYQVIRENFEIWVEMQKGLPRDGLLETA